MSFGFPLLRPTFYIVGPYPYPVRNWETCPRAKAICSKAKHDKTFSLPLLLPQFWGRRPRSCCGASSRRPHSKAPPGSTQAEVPLDVAAAKSEDCQRDIGKNLRGFPTTALN